MFDFSCRKYNDIMCTTVLVYYTLLGFKYCPIDSPKVANSIEAFNTILVMRMLVLQMRNLVTIHGINRNI